MVMNYLKTIWFVPTNSFQSQSNNTSLQKKRNVLPIKMIRVKGGITIIPGLTRMNNKSTSHIVSFIFCLIRLIFSYANIRAFNNWLVPISHDTWYVVANWVHFLLTENIKMQGNQAIIIKMLFNSKYKRRWINVIFLQNKHNINAVS